MREGLPDELKLGFDKWIEDIRQRGGDPEKVLATKSPRAVETVAEQFGREHAGEVARAEAAYLKARAADNPLRRILQTTRRSATTSGSTTRPRRRPPSADSPWPAGSRWACG